MAAAAQRPVAAQAFEDASPVAAWRDLPSWYVVPARDRAVAPEAQRFMAQRAGATTVEVDASHAVALSHPDAVAEVIRDAAVALGTREGATHP